MTRNNAIMERCDKWYNALLIALVFGWLCWYCYPKESPQTAFVMEKLTEYETGEHDMEPRAKEVDLHRAKPASGAQTTQAKPGERYLTADDATHSVDDWNTVYVSCATNPECRRK